MNDMLDAALQLYETGFSIFPLQPREKIPCASLLPVVDGKPTWKPFTTTRATEAEIRAWFDHIPDLNLAIVCGSISGTFGLDVDGAPGVAELQQHAKLPSTPTAKTGKPDGWHVYFKLPDFTVPNKVALLPGLDTRGESGYLVAPPSIHPNGTPYRWKRRPGDTPLADAPAWLLNLLRPAPRPAHPPLPINRDANEEVDLAQRALNALAAWRRDDYMAWVEVGMSLQELDATGLSLWEAWSAGSDKYHPGECARKWASFRTLKHTLASLFYWADWDYGSSSWRPYKPPIEVNERFEVDPSAAPPTAADYPDCLPIAVRGTLNQYADDRIAPVLELWLEGIREGFIEPGIIQTVNCLVHVAEELHRGLTEHTIRQGLDQGAVLFFKNWSHKVLTIEENLQYSDLDDSLSDLLLINPCRCVGRAPEWWELNDWPTILSNTAKQAIAPILQRAFPPDSPAVAPIRAEFLDALGRPDAATLSQQLDTRYHDLLVSQPGYQDALNEARAEYGRLLRFLQNPQTAPIPKSWIYPNATLYRACCARAFIVAAGGETQYSRPKLCERIGCTDRALPGILSRAGVELVKEQFVELPVKSLAQLKALQGWNREAKGWPKAVKSSLKETAYSLGKKGVYTWAEGELAAGATLTVRFQQCNRQVVVLDRQPLKARKSKAVPQFSYAQRLVLTALLAWLLAIASEGVEPEPVPLPMLDVPEAEPAVIRDFMTGKDRYRLQLRIFWWLTWAAWRFGAKKPRETYAEQWIRRLATVATPLHIDADRALDRTTGEIIEFNRAGGELNPVQLSLDALTAAPEAVVTPIDAPAVVSPATGTSQLQAFEALKETWKSMVSQFERFRSGALLLLPPLTTGSPAPVSSSWHSPLPASP